MNNYKITALEYSFTLCEDVSHCDWFKKELNGKS